MAYSCNMILDSVSPAGARLTTLEITYPRPVHSELLTHRDFSRNSSSSRAIPIAKLRQRVIDDPFIPVHWGRNQRGMQAHEELVGEARKDALAAWLRSRDSAVAASIELEALGLHKQIVNRVLEPWMWITVLITATEWENFFAQRDHRDAQPEIAKIAKMMRDCRDASTPTLRSRHTPYIRQDDIEWAENHTSPFTLLSRLSVARCARVSYLTHDGVFDRESDLRLESQLSSSSPPHWSPYEHVALATGSATERCANFVGWRQRRHMTV